jgi:hypothetical protein
VLEIVKEYAVHAFLISDIWKDITIGQLVYRKLLTGENIYGNIENIQLYKLLK